MRFLPFFTLFVLTQCFIYTVRCVVVLLSCLVCAIACLLFIQYFENQGVWSGFVPTTAQTYGSTVSVHVVTKEFQHIIGTGTAVQNYQMSGFTLSEKFPQHLCWQLLLPDYGLDGWHFLFPDRSFRLFIELHSFIPDWVSLSLFEGDKCVKQITV